MAVDVAGRRVAFVKWPFILAAWSHFLLQRRGRTRGRLYKLAELPKIDGHETAGGARRAATPDVCLIIFIDGIPA
jgi:hypothetical protein